MLFLTRFFTIYLSDSRFLPNYYNNSASACRLLYARLGDVVDYRDKLQPKKD
jgi:hypothetical protein